MTAWSVDVIGAKDERDSHDVRCNDTAELARVVGVAAALSEARVIQIRRIPEAGESSAPADDGKAREIAAIVLREMTDPGYMVSFFDGDDQIEGVDSTDKAMRVLAEFVQQYDPIEAALAQWEARWQQLRDSLRSSVGEGRDSEELARVHYAMDVIEQTVPVGKR